MPKPIHVFDKYEVIRRIASGGMGDIFLARQTGVAGFDRLVVLKSLRPEVNDREEFLAQFLNEASTAAKLNHPNVVAIYEIGEYRGVYFIAMEHINGGDLTLVLKTAGGARQRIPFRFSAAVVEGAALGLHHAHTAVDETGQALGFVHRDVSPHNIMVRLDGLAKVVDFGIAAAANSVDPYRGVRLQGKLRYMSPEQLRGVQLTGLSDQFSLGIVLWELCTQRPLFRRKHNRTVFNAILQDRIRSPREFVPDLPKSLEAIIMTMLARNPEKRFVDCQQAGRALHQYLESSGGLADQLVGKYLTLLVGTKIGEKTKNLTPEMVTISGLLDTAQQACKTCGRKNDLRNRFCAGCGAPLTEQPVKEIEAPVSVTPKIAPKPRALELLRDSAEALTDLLSGEKKEVVVVAGFVAGRKAVTKKLESTAAEALESHFVRRLTQVADAFQGLIIRLTSDTFSFVFGALKGHPSDVDRALSCALEIQQVGRRVFLGMPGEVSLGIVIDNGTSEVIQQGPGRVDVMGEAVNRAPEMAKALSRSGIFFTEQAANKAMHLADLDPITIQTDDKTINCYAFQELFKKAITPTTPFHGRREELVLGRETISRAADGVRGALAYIADPGAGKTRLLCELRALAEKLGLLTVSIDCAAEQSSGGSVINRTVRKVVLGLNLQNQEDTDEQLKKNLKKLEDLGVSRATLDRVYLLLTSALLPVEWDEKIRSEAALITVLRRSCEIHPVCILVDDLHLADESAIIFFKDLFERAQKTRLALLCTVDRLELRGLDLPWQNQSLAPMSDELLLAIAQTLTDDQSLPPMAAHVLLDRSAGSPATALLLVQIMLDLGGLTCVDGRWLATDRWSDIDFPHHFDQLVHTRLDRLSKKVQRFLRVGAVGGMTFSVELVFGCLEIPSAEHQEILTESIKSKLVRQSDDDYLVFEQPSIRRALLGRFLEKDLKRVHERLAAILTQKGDPNDPITIRAIAHHLLAAGAGLSAARAAVKAARTHGLTTAAATLYHEAAQIYTDAIESAPEPNETIAEGIHSLIRHGLPCISIFDTPDALALGMLLDKIPDTLNPGGRSQALRVRGRLKSRLGRLKTALADLEEALRLVEDLPNPEPRALVMADLGAAMETQGRLKEAAQQIMQSITLVETRIPQDESFFWTQTNALGRLFFRMGDLAKAAELFDEALDQARLVKSLDGEAKTLTNQAAILAATEKFTEAMVKLDRAAEAAAEEGDAQNTSRVAYNRGRLFLQQGDIVSAKSAFELSVESAKEVGWNEGLALAVQALSSL